jgi:hypothetical protein
MMSQVVLPSPMLPPIGRLLPTRALFGCGMRRPSESRMDPTLTGDIRKVGLYGPQDDAT